MTEFTKDDIEHYRKQYALWTSRGRITPEELHLIGRLRDALDEIERLQARIAELEQERAGILTVLDEVIGEAKLQDPFSDEAGKAMLYGAEILLEKMQPQPPKDGE